MGQYLVKKAEGPVDWRVTVPGSKSVTNRALLLAALSSGDVELAGVQFSDDSRHFISSLKSLGFSIDVDEPGRRALVRGCGGAIPKREASIDVGSAGTAARFLVAMLALSDGTYEVDASEQMRRRPMRPLFEMLESAGARIECHGGEGRLPATVKGRGRAGHLDLSLDISESTQFLSAILLVSPMALDGLRVRITSEKKDGSYVRITRGMLSDFGAEVSFDGRDYVVPPGASLHRDRYDIEPDASAACYFYAAAAATGGRALVEGVHFSSTQGDVKFLGVLRDMGCSLLETPEGIALQGPPGGALRGISVDMNDFSDQALTLAAIAPFADSPVRISGIGHTRRQECDRVHAIAAELGRLNIRCDEEEGAVTIYPGAPSAGVVETYDDHRVAMAFSLIGLRADGIAIKDPECCRKTYEGYFDELDRLCGGTGNAL